MLIFNRRLILFASVLALTAILPGLLINRINWDAMGPALSKSILYVIITLLFVCFRPVATFLLNLPKPHRILLSIFFVLLLFAQTVHRSASTFPFVSWHMYSEVPNAKYATYYDFYAVDEKGDEEEIYPSQMFPRLRRLIIYALQKWLGPIWKMREQAAEEKEVEPIPEKTGLKKMAVPIRTYFTEWPTVSEEEAIDQLNRTLTAIGVRYRQLNPEKTLVAIRVYRGEILPTMHAKPKRSDAPMWEVKIS